ncbi:MAG: hypothetical protein IPM14_09565 [bacterium]|nr:hypothetical protein [bacterium]
MKIIIKHSYKLLLLITTVAFIAFGFLGDDKTGVKSPRPIYKITSELASGKQGDAYALNVNNVYMPLNRKGIIADVNVPPLGTLGQFAGGGFLFSGGFFLSGLRGGTPWANAAASASLVEDYVQGVVDGENDPNAVLYVINSQDEPFGQSWQDWSDAVALGADFVDGDGDGVYNPVDKNGNGMWDPDEDMPDLVGDELVWCVFHDGLPVAQRRWNTTIEVGIEVRQSVFAFASAGAIGNIIFVRYRMKYVGLNESDPDQLTDVYFGAWADPDLGDATDDVVGVDVPRNAGYTYGNGPDINYGNQVPAFFIDFFSGPRAYIAGETYIDVNGNNVYDEGDTPLDTAFSVQGQIKGVVEYPGAKNLPISSFVVYFNGVAALGDPDDINEARNYMLGLDRFGVPVNPCTFAFGEVRGGVDCTTIDPRFWYSGDPVTDVGWICNQNRDVRQMTNSGPFVLNKNEENEIVIAYVVGKGANPLDGITATRAIDDGAQNIFDLNFLAPTPPPAPQVTLTSSDDFIDIIWPTNRQVAYVSQTPTWDLKFEGYQIWAFKTNVAEDEVSGQDNSILVGRYDLNNFIQNVYKENAETGGIELLYEVSPSGNQLNYSIYADPSTGRIRLRLFNDPFEPNKKIYKGRPYYFAVTSYALNYDALIYKDDPGQPIGTVGNYYLSSFAFAQEAENIRSILSIFAGEDNYTPPALPQSASQIIGGSRGNVEFDPVNNDELTGDKYRVTFYQDSSTQLYSTYWNLENLNTGTVYDSLKYYLYGLTEISRVPTEGFITRISDEVATVDTELAYQFAGPEWVNTASSVFNYVTNDAQYASKILNIGGQLTTYWGTYVNAGRLRRVEIKFGETQKAYRYLNGFFGPTSAQPRFFKYAEGITPADTVGKGTIGQWDSITDRPLGYVDVPFQVWVEDPNFGERRQLAVGFVEKRASYGGNPDGVWDPGTNVVGSGEYIFIFDEPYDPDGNQRIYKGGTYIGPDVGWADLNGASVSNGVFYQIPLTANISQDERNKANSPFFNTLFAVGINKVSSEATWAPGDIVICGVDIYPYTEADVFEFQTKNAGTLTGEEERSLWDKVNVFPNPLFGYNTLSNYYSNTPDEPFVTFTNLPEEVTVKIYSLSGTLLRTLTTDDKDSPTSPFLRWNLQNESELRVASGMYLAIVSSPKFGDKVLKFAIIMPQKQIQRF